MKEIQICVIVIVVFINLSLKYQNLANAFISEGIYAVTDYKYNGALSDNAISGLSRGSKYLVSAYTGSMNLFEDTVRECKMFCLQFDDCRSIVIDRFNRICFASTFDRCKNSSFTTFLRENLQYVTYDIIPGNTNQTIVTCFQYCLNLADNDCNQCGRLWCTGLACNQCRKACWEIPPLNETTFFWTSMAYNTYATCHGPWQSAFSSSSDQTYPDMNLEPLWLQVLVTLSNGSTYNSYFDSVIFSGYQITVENYLGGNAGNPWGAPQTLAMSHFPNTTTCNGFYYAEQPTCNISSTQIPTIATQAANGIIYFTRGYVWSICNQPSFPSNINVYVSNIELLVTPANNSVANEFNWPVPNKC